MREAFNERYTKAISGREKNLSCSLWNELELSQADTFIEFCFEKACAQVKNGMTILTEWRCRKDQYCNMTDTIVFDFGHYSRHDSSHSINILETIELILGDNRLVCLSRADLWLLLESAYSHDIGMALTGKELHDIWINPEFKQYLIECLNSNWKDSRQASMYYHQMDMTLRDPKKLNEYEKKYEKCIFDDCWPAEISNYVKWLVSDFIRKYHSERNAAVKERIVTLKNPEIPKRLYRIASTISALHTENEYEKILKELKYEEKGIGAELTYPRFTAAMLRIGDVLDVENNRFSIYSVEHMIHMPSESTLHLLKHEAIRHILITTSEIQLEAVSDNLSVCKNAREWFNMVDSEVRELIYSWNEMAPPLLRGCKLKRSECHVYYNDATNGYVEYDINSQKYFQVDKQKLIELLVGTNVYNFRLDFIREYLQNAMDAVKMQMWKDIYDGHYSDIMDMQKVKEKQLQLSDIPQEVYNRYEVKVTVQTSEENYQNLLLTIEDNGIGIEDECMDVISHIGSGWRGRKKYSQMIEQMPAWLQPTGGFGIGIQSAFMATGKVVIETQTNEENTGRKIILSGPNSGGEIIVEGYRLGHRGTRVKVEIPIDLFLKWNQMISEEGKNIFEKVQFDDKVGSDIFSRNYIEGYAREVLKKYIQSIIPNPVIQIKICVHGFETFTFQFPLSKIDSIKQRPINWNQHQYNILFQNGTEICVWDCANMNLVIIRWKPHLKEQFICYKNVRMLDEQSLLDVISDKISVYIDFMGFPAHDIINIHRNAFKSGFDKEKYVNEYISLYFHLMLKEIEKMDTEWDIEFLITQMVYLTNKEDREQFEKILKMLCESNPEQYMILGKQIEILPPDVPKQLPKEDGGDIIDIEIDINEPNGIKLQDKKWNLYKIYQKYKKMIESDGDGGENLLIDISDKKKEENAFTVDFFRNWIFQNMIYENEWKFQESANSTHVFYSLIKNGIIEQGYLGKLLRTQSGLKNNTNIVRDISGINIEFDSFRPYREKVEKNNVNLTDFYMQSWNEKHSSFFSPYPEEYACISVTQLPYQESETGKTYVIRPISADWIVKYKAKNSYDENLGRRVLSKQEFITLVMGEDIDNPEEQFGYIMQWVWNHAASFDTRKDRTIIWEFYQRYVGGIFDEALNGQKW